MFRTQIPYSIQWATNSDCIFEENNCFKNVYLKIGNHKKIHINIKAPKLMKIEDKLYL